MSPCFSLTDHLAPNAVVVLTTVAGFRGWGRWIRKKGDAVSVKGSHLEPNAEYRVESVRSKGGIVVVRTAAVLTYTCWSSAIL